MSRLPLLPLVLLLGCPGPAKNTDTSSTVVEPTDEDGDGAAAEADCDDADATSFPGAPELCDGKDNNCDGAVDENPTDASTWYADSDGDGYGDPAAHRTSCDAPAGYVADATDCNDASDQYHPGATETACAGPDYNCNGVFDEGDADGDGFASCDDCDDTRMEVHPGLPEACDGLDNDCNGIIDDGAGDSSTFYADTDGDLYGDRAAPIEACALPPGASETANDCDDTRADVHPGADETCNGIDDDCDDETDEEPIDPGTFYQDRDGDGYGNAAVVSASTCDAPAGYVTDATDCNDVASNIHPGAAEYCGGTDYDCDGAANEASSVDIQPYYSDTDADGYYGTYVGSACTAPANTSFTYQDCDETSASVNPAAEDICDDVDNDCDGAIDDGNRVPEDYATIQAAINASATGEHVCVAAGNYVENLDFGGRGITLEGEDGSSVTRVYGTGTTSVVNLDNYESNPVIRGLTISGGSEGYGGGVYAVGTDLTLDDVAITGNTCYDYYCYGTGLYVSGGSLTATDLAVEDNYAELALSSSSYLYAVGTGMFVSGATVDLDRVSVTGNGQILSAITGSSAYGYGYAAGMELSGVTGLATDIQVNDNYTYRSTASTGYAYGYGTGITLISSTVSFDGLEVWGNQSYLYGTYDNQWGVGIYENYDTSTFDHVDVRANVVDAYAAQGVGWTVYAYSTPVITNAIIAGNKASYSGTGGYNYVYGVGLEAYYYGAPTLVNADIVGNKASGYYAMGGGIDLDYYGGITADNVSVYANTLSTTYAYGGAVYLYSSSYSSGYSFSYCNFYGNTAAEFYGMSTVVGGGGNVAVKPGYTSSSASDSTTWDLTLTATSSMKNAGDTAISDVDGSRSDIGAYGGPGGGW